MRIAVAIPCYKVTQHVLDVIAAIGPEVQTIYAVDDACPDGSGALINEQCRDSRVKVLMHSNNQGVGAAMVTAYKAALHDGMDIIVKIDGDGQMDPALIARFVQPILKRQADYTKGNRFYRPESLRPMPLIRIIGNAGLSFINKFSSGYWPIMDPTNGYTAIHATALRALPLDKLEKRYFFESDMLYHLNLIRAVVRDVPMDAVYADEVSGLSAARALPEFFIKHSQRFFKRYVYSYLVRDFNLGSIYSLTGLPLFLLGFIFGIVEWISSIHSGQAASSGTVMLAALPMLLGAQFLIAFLHADVASVPSKPLLADHVADTDELPATRPRQPRG